MGKWGVKDADRVQLPYWEYLWGNTYTNPDNQAVPVPSEATIFEIDAEDDECFYNINQGFAGPLSPGYVSLNGERIVGPLANLNSLHVHGTNAIVHIQFFRER